MEQDDQEDQNSRRDETQQDAEQGEWVLYLRKGVQRFRKTTKLERQSHKEKNHTNLAQPDKK